MVTTPANNASPPGATRVIFVCAVPVLAVAGLSSVISFHLGFYFPVWLSVAVFALISAYLIAAYLHRRIGAFILLFWLVFALPFIHLVEYLALDPDGAMPTVMWGLATNPYTFDDEIVRLMGMIGAVGAIGFSLGVSFSRRTLVFTMARSDAIASRALATPIWLVWLFVAVLLSWLAAPQETIFTAIYTHSLSPLDGYNFSSAWMISYVLLTFSLLDGVFDYNPVRRKLKLVLSLFALLFVVVHLQLLRGDREAIPFVFALLLAYFHWASPLTRQGDMKLPWKRLAIAAVILVLVSMVFGTLRSELADVRSVEQLLAALNTLADSGLLSLSRAAAGTWSAVLLTPLSVAGDHVRGLLSFNLGQDYVNLLLSMPPGFIADAIGYFRPIDSLSGPAWEMRYGIGGTHATVLPFMNFGMAGVLGVVAFWAYLLAACEKRTLRQLSSVGLALLTTLAMASPHWLWYGEKSGINALLIWLVLTVCYRISQGLSILMFNVNPELSKWRPSEA